MEKIISNNLHNHFTTNNLITKNQSGFRHGDSTRNQLIDLVDEIHQSFDDTKSLEVRTIFLDISKAILIRYGTKGSLQKLLQNYLNNRKQRVVLNGSSADFSTIESGAPQGSVPSPPLFLIYVNDLEKNIKSNIKYFAGLSLEAGV